MVLVSSIYMEHTSRDTTAEFGYGRTRVKRVTGVSFGAHEGRAPSRNRRVDNGAAAVASSSGPELARRQCKAVLGVSENIYVHVTPGQWLDSRDRISRGWTWMCVFFLLPVVLKSGDHGFCSPQTCGCFGHSVVCVFLAWLHSKISAGRRWRMVQ